MNTPVEPVAPVTAVNHTDTRSKRLPRPGAPHEQPTCVQPGVGKPPGWPMQGGPLGAVLSDEGSDQPGKA